MKLFIATPTVQMGKYLTLDKILHRECGTDGKDIFLASVEKLVADKPSSFIVRPVPGIAPIGLARNFAAAEFLKTDCTDLLFIDSDIGFTCEQIQRIAAQDGEVVGGLYPLKQDGPPKLVVVLLDGEGVNQANGLQSVAGIGAGFLRINRSVFEQLKPLVETYANGFGEQEWNFFPHGVDNGRYWGEDLAFCNLCRANGIKIFADWGIRLLHQGHDKIFSCEAEKQTTSTQPTTPQ